ncbi:MAG TPA: pentapeptide repeat-containing protein, partial [Rhizomicrobium sp.]|nr:pentapeptide repeat-containing protein [Rhizomicrobium sp.]
SGGTQGNHCVLDGEDIRLLQKLVVGRPLTGLSARNTISIGLNFSGCQLQGARFDGADLRDANFTGADLRGASLRGARLTHACFDKADLRGLALTTGQLRVTDLTDAIGREDQFATALLDDKAATLALAGQMRPAA